MNSKSIADANMIVRTQLARRIRSLRKANHLSQTALSSFCKLHTSHVSKIERGEANLTLSILVAIAVALKTNLADLFADISFSDDLRQLQNSASDPTRIHSRKAIPTP